MILLKRNKHFKLSNKISRLIILKLFSSTFFFFFQLILVSKQEKNHIGILVFQLSPFNWFAQNLFSSIPFPVLSKANLPSSNFIFPRLVPSMNDKRADRRNNRQRNVTRMEPLSIAVTDGLKNVLDVGLIYISEEFYQYSF